MFLLAVSTSDVVIESKKERPINAENRVTVDGTKKDLNGEIINHKNERFSWKIYKFHFDGTYAETRKSVVSNKKLDNISSVPQPKTVGLLKPKLLDDKNEIIAETKLFNLLSAKNINLKELKSLIKQGVDINCLYKTPGFNRFYQGITPLLFLLNERNDKDNFINALQLLLENGANTNAIDIDGSNALHTACRFYQFDNLVEVIRLLIKYGAEGKQNYLGFTPLHFLCRLYNPNYNIIEVIRLLVEHGGVDVNAKTYNERTTALIYACLSQKENFIEIIRIFMKHGADARYKNKYGTNAYDLVKYDKNRKDKNEILKLFGYWSNKWMNSFSFLLTT